MARTRSLELARDDCDASVLAAPCNETAGPWSPDPDGRVDAESRLLHWRSDWCARYFSRLRFDDASCEGREERRESATETLHKPPISHTRP